MTDSPLDFHERASQVAPPVRSGEVLADLIARLEKATGPDRELDNAIWSTLDQPLPDDPVGCPPHYTGSIDAALTIVPGNNWWEISQQYSPTSPMRNFGPASGIFKALTHSNYGERGYAGYHDTPAIALCIAALRARAATAMTAQAEEQSPLSRETK